MISVYCQYSFGGFRIFRIYGTENESLDASKEVTSDNALDYPDGANIFFDRGGTKVAYRYLDDGRLVLTVKEIPGPDKDTDGRRINCAVQFIGDEPDRKALDNMAITICNDISGFERFFSDLFSKRSGLHIDGDRLKEYVGAFSRENACPQEESELSAISGVRSGVILFVPVSDSFMTDSFVRDKVMKELQFSDKDMRHAVVIPSSRLAAMHVKLSGKVEKETAPSADADSANDRQDPGDAGDERHSDDDGKLRQRVLELSIQNDELRRQLSQLSGRRTDGYKEKYEYCKKINRYLLYSLGAAVFIILLMIIF